MYEIGSAVNRFWTEQANHRAVLDEIAQDLGITEVLQRFHDNSSLISQQMVDWYGVSWKEIETHPRGRDIFLRFPSLSKAVESTYPDFAWDSAKFVQSEELSANMMKRRRKVLAKVAAKLGVTQVMFSI